MGETCLDAAFGQRTSALSGIGAGFVRQRLDQRAARKKG